MNYKFEPIMSWLMYIRLGIWNVGTTNHYADDPDVVIGRYRDLFKNELMREYNDCKHTVYGLGNQIGTISVFINPDKNKFAVSDNYNNLMSFYNGVYKEFDGMKLCIDTKAKGLDTTNYFKFLKEEDERYISIRSIVEGKCNNNSANVRRIISIMFSRGFQYLESTNPEAYMFMDYDVDEKEKMIKECEDYDKWINKKKEKKDVVLEW